MHLIEAIEEELKKEAHSYGILVTKSEENSFFEFRKDWVLIGTIQLYYWGLQEIRCICCFSQYKNDIRSLRHHSFIINLNHPYELQMRIRDLVSAIQDLKEIDTTS